MKTGQLHIAIIWQRYLPYHFARIRRLQECCYEIGYKLSAIEVASQDETYSFPDTICGDFQHYCCFPGKSYHRLGLDEIRREVLSTLETLQPDIVFAPATAFPEGMAAYAYCISTDIKAVMMDDAWTHSDQRGRLTRFVKRQIHQNITAAFIPAPSHATYYESLGFPQERIVFGVDVVDNEFFARNAEIARLNSWTLRKSFGLPDNYFLFVGRFLPRKGLEFLVQEYQSYRKQTTTKLWSLVLVGSGEHFDSVRKLAGDTAGIVFAGPRFGSELATFYGLADALVVPSEADPWALVVNEGMATGLPLIVSRGCGAAHTLVRVGKNGWTFEPGDAGTLAHTMAKISGLSDSALATMGAISKEIIADWSLDRFVDGVFKAIEIPRRPSTGFLANLLTKLWKGRVSVN
jgi:glycosyltransferase involved in cell wall biosynthesis